MSFNSRKDNRIKRMILLTPEIFENLKDILNLDNSLNNFDREIYQILKDKKLNPSQKWYRYRQSLIRQSETFRKRNKLPLVKQNTELYHSFPSKTDSEHLQKYGRRAVSDIGTQTKYIFKNDKSTEITPIKSIQTKPNLDEIIYEDDDIGIDTVDDKNNVDTTFLPNDDDDDKFDDTIVEDLDNLIPSEEFDALPKDVQKSFIQRVNEYVRNVSKLNELPPSMNILGEDGAVYNIFTDGMKKRISAWHPDSKNSINTPTERKREYLSRSAKKTAQTLINFPTRKNKGKSTNSNIKTNIKWDMIK